MKNILSIIAILSLFTSVNAQQKVYQSPAYSIFSDKVVQGKYVATAISPFEIRSNYQSPANLYQSADVVFKFAINGRDNEMVPGVDHIFSTADFGNETPLIVFGKQLKRPSASQKFLAPNTALKIKLDMREVLKQFADKGFYTTYNGERIYKEEFKGVYVAGSSAPLSWDFDNLASRPQFKLNDDDKDGIYEINMVFNKAADANVTDEVWKLSNNIRPYPTLKSGFPIADAVYNMGLDEMLKAIEPDSTFRTGKEWGGVWTRDISYSIILSMAYMQPRVAMHSLMRKVNKRKRIIQDTGTGGAWPVSSDRAVWIIAAWELYKVTGDTAWLRQSYEIAKNSMNDDLQTGFDAATGLFRGESSFLDWREQTYPKWMQPADIYESKCLGTNAVFYQANNILAAMAALNGDAREGGKFSSVAGYVKKGINEHMWMEDKGYYAQYLYGNNYQIASPRAETLGEALCILFGIADETRAKRIISSTPQTPFGSTCIYPQIPGILPYHNNGIWPFVQSYWALAGALSGNEQSVLHSLASVWRPAALFTTNKENFVAEDGDFKGTQMNSSVMLWSLSGNISLVHKILFGINYESDHLSFSPVVPRALEGIKRLENFKYRDAVIDIEVSGFGNRIKSFEINGKQRAEYMIPAIAKGKYSVKIVLDGFGVDQKVNNQNNLFSLAAPTVQYSGKVFTISPVKDAVGYKVYVNGQLKKQVTNPVWVASEKNLAEYAFSSVDKDGYESFISEPIAINSNPIVIHPEDFYTPETYAHKGFTGKGFVEISKAKNIIINIPVVIKTAGAYYIDFRYSNGSGPLNTENKCAIRTLMVDNKELGVLVFPQRGNGEWSIWGYTNSIKTFLKPGMHIITLSLKDYNENMNGDINTAMLDELRLTPVIAAQ